MQLSLPDAVFFLTVFDCDSHILTVAEPSFSSVLGCFPQEGKRIVRPNSGYSSRCQAISTDTIPVTWYLFL